MESSKSSYTPFRSDGVVAIITGVVLPVDGGVSIGF